MDNYYCDYELITSGALKCVLLGFTLNIFTHYFRLNLLT